MIAIKQQASAGGKVGGMLITVAAAEKDKPNTQILTDSITTFKSSLELKNLIDVRTNHHNGKAKDEDHNATDGDLRRLCLRACQQWLKQPKIVIRQSDEDIPAHNYNEENWC